MKISTKTFKTASMINGLEKKDSIYLLSGRVCDGEDITKAILAENYEQAEELFINFIKAIVLSDEDMDGVEIYIERIEKLMDMELLVA